MIYYTNNTSTDTRQKKIKINKYSKSIMCDGCLYIFEPENIWIPLEMEQE